MAKRVWQFTRTRKLRDIPLFRRRRARRAAAPKLFSRTRFSVVKAGENLLDLYSRQTDGLSLLEAIDFCFRTGREVPLQMRNAFCSHYLAWALFQHRTLDEAFGVELPRRIHFEGRKQREKLRFLVVLHVVRLSQLGEPLTGPLFEKVGEALGLSSGECSAIFYEAESDGLRALLQGARFS